MGRPATGRTTGTLGVRLSHAELTELYRPAANLSLYVTQDGFSLKVNPRENGAGEAE